MTALVGRSSLVAGASRGLGRALCEALANLGSEVLAVCRTAPRGLEAPAIRVLNGVDLRNDRDVARVAEAVVKPLDLVVYNAGVAESVEPFGELRPAAMLNEYDVNALGAVRILQAVLPRLGDGAKVALISTGRFASPGADHTGAAWPNYGYRMSKAALNLLGRMLAADLAPRGIAVTVLGPGGMETDMLRRSRAEGRIPAGTTFPAPEEAANALLRQIELATPADGGRWIDREGRPYP